MYECIGNEICYAKNLRRCGSGGIPCYKVIRHFNPGIVDQPVLRPDEGSGSSLALARKSDAPRLRLPQSDDDGRALYHPTIGSHPS